MTGLTSVSFHLLTADHLLLSWLSRCPAVRKAVFQPGALTDTDRLRGSQVNYINAAVSGCCFFSIHACWCSHLLGCLEKITSTKFAENVLLKIGVWVCSSWKDFFFFFFLLSRGYKESHHTRMKIKLHLSPKSFYMQISLMGGGARMQPAQKADAPVEAA